MVSEYVESREKFQLDGEEDYQGLDLESREWE